MSDMQTIVIRCYGGTTQIRAAVFGDWAAHRAHEEPGWCVTNVPTGRRLDAELTEEHARAAAALLSKRVPVLRWRDGQPAPHADDVTVVRDVIATVTKRQVNRG